MWGKLSLILLVSAVASAQSVGQGGGGPMDPSTINSRFEQIKAYQKFGNDYVSNQRNNLLFPVPYEPRDMKSVSKNARKEFDKGNDALYKSDFSSARKHYEAALADSSSFVMAHVNLAVALSNLKENDAAMQHLQTAVQLDSQCSPAYQNLAVLDIQHQDYPAAEKNLQTANKYDPADLKTLTLLAFAEAMNKDFDQAVATAHRVHLARDHSGYAYAHMIAATALDSSGHAEQAIAEYKQFITEDPSDPRVPTAKQAMEKLQAETGAAKH